MSDITKGQLLALIPEEGISLSELFKKAGIPIKKDDADAKKTQIHILKLRVLNYSLKMRVLKIQD